MDRALYIVPEIVLISITEVIFLFGTVVLIVSYLYGRLWEQTTSYYCRTGLWYKEIDKYIHNMLQMMTILEPRKESTFEEPKSKLHGFKFLRIHVYYLTFCLLWMVCIAGIVFWDVFLIDVTNSCDPSTSRAHCFLNTGFNVSDEPIDCNNLEDLPDNATFICYKYILSIGDAFGTAGGMLSTGLILLKLFAANYAYFRKRSAICSYVLWICHLVIAIISIPGTLLAINLVPSLQEIVLESSVIMMFQFFNILISMAATLVVVLAMLRKPEEEEEGDYEIQNYSASNL